MVLLKIPFHSFFCIVKIANIFLKKLYFLIDDNLCNFFLLMNIRIDIYIYISREFNDILLIFNDSLLILLCKC